MAHTYVNIGASDGGEKIIAGYFAAVTSASGTIAYPSGSTLQLESFQDLENALVSTMVGGKPDFNAALSAGGVRVVCSLDSSGAYSLSPAPAAFPSPVAIIYRVKIPIAAYDVDSPNVIVEDVERIGLGGGAVDSVNGKVGAVQIVAGSNVIVDSSGSSIVINATGGGGSVNSYFPSGW